MSRPTGHHHCSIRDTGARPQTQVSWPAWYCKISNRACVKLHKSITLISKEQGILGEKTLAKVENVIVEVENGDLPNAAMENIVSKIDSGIRSLKF